MVNWLTQGILEHKDKVIDPYVNMVLDIYMVNYANYTCKLVADEKPFVASLELVDTSQQSNAVKKFVHLISY